MEVSIAKQSSTEKNKLWKARNIVAINNYMRRINPHLNVLSTVPKALENTTLKSTLFKYETNHEQPILLSSTTPAVKSVKNISNILNRAPPTKTIYRPVQMQSLIINVPDDASPVFYNDNRNYQTSDGEFESNIKSYNNNPSNANDETTSVIENVSSTLTTENFSNIPNINHIFENVSTSFTTSIASTQSNKVPITTSSTSSSTAADNIIQNKTTKKVYTTIPRRKSTSTSTSSLPSYLPSAIFTTSQNIVSSTISSFLNNVSSRKIKLEPQQQNETTYNGSNNNKNSYNTQVELTTTTATTTTTSSKIATKNQYPITTTPSSVYGISNNEVKTSIPTNIEAVVPPSMTPDSITTSNRPIITLYEGISTTSKTHINDVFVEAQQSNASAYVFGVLGILPLIIIIFYVIKQYVYKHECSKDDDIENYGNDVQPISPVVKLDHSDDGTCSEGNESIITESDLNRNKIRFRSVLGEGNFGQVWKAEVDDLHGFIGTKIVAVKTERINNGQGGLKVECEIMRKLGSHSNVVTLLAACLDQGMHL
jgi:hypothetical protein